MKEQSEKINFIFLVLRENNIRSMNDVLKLKRRKGYLLSSKDYPWVGTICSIANEFYSDIESHIADIPGQVFMVDHIDESVHENIFKYSCVFPGRMIVSVGELFYLDNPKNALIDIDFFYKLFWGKELLKNNLVKFSPFYRYAEGTPGEGNRDDCLVEYLTLPDENEKKIAELDKCGTHGFGTVIKDNHIFLSMPWLYNASIDTYLEIINKYKNEFELYNTQLARLSDNASCTEDFLRNFEYDLKEANANISIELEKEKAKLRKQGIATVLGVAITAIPFAFSGDPVLGSAAAQSILGGVGLYQLLNDAKEHSSIKDLGRDNPFWVMWKWKNS